MSNQSTTRKAVCKNCGKTYTTNNAQALGAKHAKQTGHTVEYTQVFKKIYKGK